MSNRIATLIAIVLLISSPCRLWATDDGTTLEPLKLDQAVDLALGKNYQIRNGVLEVRISRDRFATVITLILVPVIYAIGVLDLKIVKWGD